jgi:hypothetical protein
MTHRPKIGRNDPCPCGSGRKHKKCCGSPKSAANDPFGPSEQPTLLARNLVLVDAVHEIFGTDMRKIKQRISGAQVKRLYEVVADLWPPGTNLAGLLPDDDKLRGLYLGAVEPKSIVRNIYRFSLYADEIMVVDPFHNPNWSIGGHNPISNPDAFKADTLKLVFFTYMLAPWIAAGLVKLVPNPGWLDASLRTKFIEMAQGRIGEPDEEILNQMVEESEEETEADFHRLFYTLPIEYKMRKIKELFPNMDDGEVSDVLRHWAIEQRSDPLALEQPITETGGQVQSQHTGANLETALYLCHLTGAFPYTNLKWKWNELLSVAQDFPEDAHTWSPLTRAF